MRDVQMGEAVSSPHCCDVVHRVRTSGTNPAYLDRVLYTSSMCYSSILGPSLIQTTAGLSSSEVRVDHLMERYMYLPWGPRS